MAAAGRTQNFKTLTVAAIFIMAILGALPVWGAGQAALAGVGDNQPVMNVADGDGADGIIVGWDERGKDPQAVLEALEEASRGNSASEKASQESLKDDLREWAESLDAGEWPAPHVQALSLPPGMSLDQTVKAISSLPGVNYVEPDYRARADMVTADPYYDRQWFLPHVGVDKAWEVERGSGSLVVAVLDTGVDASHPDLAGRVLEGYNAVDGDTDVSDVYGHGTHVAGIIAASGENGVGVAGLAWRVNILPVKVLDDQGNGRYSDIISGIRYAADRGAAVINLSLGGGAESRALQEAVDYARSRGAAVVAAAGNEALGTLSYPAACEGVIGVGATDNQDRLTTFTNRGQGLDLVAPGISIYSDIPGGGYAYKSGTSMAAPQVSGALALLLSRNPGLGTAEAERRILSTARDLGSAGYDTDYGWGLLQADKALGLEESTQNNLEAGGGGWYFAEGYTGPGFDTYILLENPSTTTTAARLELFGSQGPCGAKEVGIGAQARLTLRLNDLAPAGEVAVRVAVPEGSSLVAQRSMYFDYQGIRGGHTSRGCPASNTWYFAEGYTGPGYYTYLLVFNPQAEAARVDLELLTPGGTQRQTMEVPPLSRRTLKLNDVFPGAELAMALSADRPVVAERSMYFDAGGRRGGSCSAGIPSTSEKWYFAEGYTGGGFDEWLLLANPAQAAVTASATFMRGDGMVVRRELELSPSSRATLHVDEIPGFEEAQVSVSVEASSPGVVAERAMYFYYNGSMGAVGGGHAAGGAIAPSSHWLVPEGYTGPGFESWILICNLENADTTVSLDLYGESGARVRREYTIPAHSRFTVKENDLLPGQGVSAEVSATDGARLVVEGSFYFRYAGNIDDGSC